MAKRDRNGVSSFSAPLAERLENYSDLTRRSVSNTSLRERLGNWPVYAAVAGSALATATGASANIIPGVYNGASVQPGASSKSSIKGLTFIEFGAAELNIKAISGSAGAFVQLGVSAFSPVQIFATAANQNAMNFAKSAAISSHAGPRTSNPLAVAAFFSGSPFGKFVAGVPGYVGLAIKTGGGQFDYGWVKLVFTNAISGLPQTLTALSFGVEETPGVAIKAGQTSDAVVSSTPEPGTMTLTLLATGAAAVIALRRRRLQG